MLPLAHPFDPEPVSKLFLSLARGYPAAETYRPRISSGRGPDLSTAAAWTAQRALLILGR